MQAIKKNAGEHGNPESDAAQVQLRLKGCITKGFRAFKRRIPWRLHGLGHEALDQHLPGLSNPFEIQSKTVCARRPLSGSENGHAQPHVSAVKRNEKAQAVRHGGNGVNDFESTPNDER